MLMMSEHVGYVPDALAMTATFAAIASIMALGKPSAQEGRTKISAELNSLSFDYHGPAIEYNIRIHIALGTKCLAFSSALPLPAIVNTKECLELSTLQARKSKYLFSF